MDKENNATHVNPNKNDAWKDRLIKKLKTKNFQFRSVERNREGIENHCKNKFNWSRGIEATQEFKLKTEFSFCHFDRSKNRLDWSNPEETKNLKILENFFCRNIWKNCFYDMRFLSLISNVLRNQTFLWKIQTLSIFFNLFFSHTLKMH